MVITDETNSMDEINIPREAVHAIFEESIYPTVDTMDSMLPGKINYESLKNATHVCLLSDFLKPNKIVYNLSCRVNCEGEDKPSQILMY